MKAATVFKNGQSTQAIRIPKEYRISTKEVWIEKKGDTLIIKPKPSSWEDFFYGPSLPEDFSLERNQLPSQSREELL